MTSAVRAYKNPRVGILVLQAVALTVVGLAVGLALSGSSLPLQIAAAAAAAFLTPWAVPLLWTGVATLDAPRRQRNEARSLISSERQHSEEVLEAEHANHQQAIDRLDAIIKEN